MKSMVGVIFCVFACAAGSHFLLCHMPFFDDPTLSGKSEFVLFPGFRLCGGQSLFVVPQKVTKKGTKGGSTTHFAQVESPLGSPVTTQGFSAATGLWDGFYSKIYTHMLRRPKKSQHWALLL